MKSKILFSVCVSLAASAAFADSTPTQAYSYRVEVPSDQTTCDQQAQQLATTFAQATQAQVTGAYCQGSRVLTDSSVQYGINALVVNYVAASEMTPFRALISGDSFENVPSDLEGLFTTYAACLAEMNKQVSVFESQSGLKAVATHCDHAPDSWDNTYTLVIEGFGDAKNKLYTYDVHSPSEMDDGPLKTQVLSSAQTAIQTLGGTVAFTDSSHIFYYALYAIEVFYHQMGTYSDASQCATQLSTAQQILSNEKFEGVSAFCSQTYPTSYALTFVAAGSDVLDPTTLNTHYASYADCMKDKDRAVANATATGAAKFYGAICRTDIYSSDFLLDLYFEQSY